MFCAGRILLVTNSKSVTNTFQFIYNCAPFPMQQLPELREKYTYNIRPFTSAAGNRKSALLGNMLPSDEDDLDEEDLEAIHCFTGIIPGQMGAGRLRGRMIIGHTENHLFFAIFHFRHSQLSKPSKILFRSLTLWLSL